MSRLTYGSKDGSWGLKGLSWEQLVALPPRVYGALAKLKQMEDLVDDIGGAQPEVGGDWPWRSCSPWGRMGFIQICGRR